MDVQKTFNNLYFEAKMCAKCINKDDAESIASFNSLLRQIEATIKHAKKEKRNGNFSAATLSSMNDAYAYLCLPGSRCR